MRARSGLQTEYMGNEWFDNTSAERKSANIDVAGKELDIKGINAICVKIDDTEK